MGTDKRKFGGVLYVGRKNERSFQQKEIARARTRRHSEAPSARRDAISFLAGPRKILNASAYHFKGPVVATRV